uniref:ATP synthase subunit a n=1 Tax=Lutraria rhynchaena TaxID=1380851 RepID=W1I7V3_9BIVA|nr:ATP synthase F0 subunit 6 [Lutraria rhynchaena]CDL72587.1 ATP synthase F0 subunit 6 [Lutraria rhynchaena]
MDLLSFMDYSRGTGFFPLNILHWFSGLFLFFFIILSGSYWQASCREWAFLGVVESSMGKAMAGRKMAMTGGSLQLVLSLFFTLLCLNFATLLPFSYPLVTHLTVTASLSLVFWGATVLSHVNLNWRGFLSQFVMQQGVAASLAFQALEFTTIMIRGLTLCVRMTVNLFISMIFAKIFFSVSLALWWDWGSWSGFIGLVMAYMFTVIYYMMEWVVGFVQSLLFVVLIITYMDESVFSVVEELDVHTLSSGFKK